MCFRAIKIVVVVFSLERGKRLPLRVTRVFKLNWTSLFFEFLKLCDCNRFFRLVAAYGSGMCRSSMSLLFKVKLFCPFLLPRFFIWQCLAREIQKNRLLVFYYAHHQIVMIIAATAANQPATKNEF